MTGARANEDILVQGDSDSFALDLGPGYLGASLLPVRLVAAAYESVMADYPTAALSYGPEQGAMPAREAISILRGSDPDAIMVTGGISTALDAIAAIYRPHGGTVITEAVSYDLANAVFRDHGYNVARMPPDETDPAHALERALKQHRGDVAFVYLIPTLANPTGRTLTEEQRQDVIEVALRFDVPIIEDDAYADHIDPAHQRTSLAALGLHLHTLDGRPLVVGLGSASKVLASIFLRVDMLT